MCSGVEKSRIVVILSGDIGRYFGILSTLGFNLTDNCSGDHDYGDHLYVFLCLLLVDR